MIKYTISIVTVNQLEKLKACLNSVFSHSTAGSFEVIVTDNGATQEIKQYLKLQGLGLGILTFEKNVGFIKAQNNALTYAHGDFFIPLNDDVEILTPGWLELMEEEFYKDDAVGLVGVRNTCTEIGSDFIGRPGSLEYIEGSCLMIPVCLARRYGLFDTIYEWGYYEDADLSLRLRQKGFKLAIAPVDIKHDRASTASTFSNTPISLPRVFEIRNRAYFKDKWATYLTKRHFEERVIIKRLQARGDVLWVSSVVRRMKEEYPERKITVCTHYPEILQNNPLIENITESWNVAPSFEKNFDLDLSYERKNKKIVEAYYEVCELPPPYLLPEIYFPEGMKEKILTEFGEYKEHPRKAVFHTGLTQWNGRNVPLTTFIEVAKHLKEDGWCIIEVGDHATEHLPVADLDFRNKTSAIETAAFLSHCNLFVGIDSYPSTVAMALRLPAVVCFGMIDPKKRIVEPHWVEAITADPEKFPCLGCHHWPPYPKISSQCPIVPAGSQYAPCMLAITPNQIMNGIQRVLSRPPSETSKIRHIVLQYCNGMGIDIGCGPDKIKPDCVGFDKAQMKNAVDVIGNAELPLPFPDQHFDYIFSSHMLEDTVHPRRVLSHWLRCLKSGGYLILYLPQHGVYIENNPYHNQHFTPANICPLLQSLDLKILQIRTEYPDGYSFLVVAQKGGEK